MKSAFSLMEMMVVLLIVAVVAAATAPMVTKKMARSTGSGDSPWLFTGTNGNIVYNMNKADISAIIGASSYATDNNGPTHPRLVIASGADANRPALAFADQDGNFSGQINMNKTTGVVALNNSLVGNNSVAGGMGQTTSKTDNSGTTTYSGIVAIGQGVTTTASDTIAIGQSATTSGTDAIAIGRYTVAEKENAIAIGTNSKALNKDTIAINGRAKGGGSIAIGEYASATGPQAIAIGYSAKANSNVNDKNYPDGTANSIAIGSYATAGKNQIVLGTEYDTVYIPGTLRVGGISYFGVDTTIGNNQSSIWEKLGGKDSYKGNTGFIVNTSNADAHLNVTTSDRRLKNVGEKYTAGLEELKKLDFYHYTFKKDEAKTPMVGVMAQDLQKVFPDAVMKGDDGFLRIRLEDMFYAVINAVKELDTRINDIKTSFSSKLDAQEQRIANLEKQNAELQKENSELKEDIKAIKKRINKLEK